MQPHPVYQYINDPAMRNEGVAFVHDGLDYGRLEPVIDRVFEFDDYRSAFEYWWQLSPGAGSWSSGPDIDIDPWA